MSDDNQKIGALGEKIAANFLLENHYIIIIKNYRTKLGEIDIVAKKDNKVLFVEVKTRIGIDKGMPWEAVTYSKIKRMQRSAQYFLLKNNYKDCKLSLDVIAVILNPDRTMQSIKHYENITN